MSTRSKGAATPALRTVSGSLKAPTSSGPAKKKQKLNDSSAKAALAQVDTPAVPSSTSGKLSRSTTTSGRRTRQSARVAAAAVPTPSVCAPTPSVYVHQDSRPTGAAHRVVPQFTERARLPLTVVGSNTPPRVYRALPRSEKDNNSSSSPAKPAMQPKERGLLFPSRPLPSVPTTTANARRPPSPLRKVVLFTKEDVAPPVYGMMAVTAAALGDAPKQRRGERRESFRPRASNAGLDLPEFRRRRGSIRSGAVAELEEGPESES
jgi:hypothetical protein